MPTVLFQACLRVPSHISLLSVSSCLFFYLPTSSFCVEPREGDSEEEGEKAMGGKTEGGRPR
eukprot:2014691-Pyramimonas_sp.AAC.1